MREERPHIGWFRAHAASVKHCASHAGYCHLSATSKAHSSILSWQLPLFDGIHVRSLNSMSMCPFLHYFRHKVYSLVRSNAVWDMMKADEAFCKWTDGRFGRSFTCRTDKLIPRIQVNSNKDEMLHFWWWKQFIIFNLLPDYRMITSGHGAMSKNPCCYLVGRLVFSSGCSHL